MGGSAAPGDINYGAIAKSGAKNPGNEQISVPTPNGQITPIYTNPGTSPFGPAAMPNYSGAFQNALNAARGNINQQLQTALGDIQNSQKAAGQALGQYAPQVNAAWNSTQGEQQNALGAIGQAQQHAGLGGQNLSAYFAPEQAAQSLAHTQQLGNQSLLQAGINQQTDRERSLAQLGAQSQMGQLDMQQASFAQQQQQMAMQNQQAERMAQLQQGYAQQNALSNYGFQSSLNQQQNAAAAGQNNNPATGPYAQSGLTQGQVQQAQSSPQYQQYMQLIQSLVGKSPAEMKKGGLNLDTVGHMFQQLTASNPQLASVLAATAPADWAKTWAPYFGLK